MTVIDPVVNKHDCNVQTVVTDNCPDNTHQTLSVVVVDDDDAAGHPRLRITC